MTDLPTVPVALRVHLAHATVQAIADEAGVDLLHLKGPAVDPALRPEGRSSVDADVLVRPAHLDRLLGGLMRHGWQQVTTLLSGGLVEHSTNWYHGELGQMDIHVRFPGIQVTPARAFELLWEGRGTQDIAHRPCVVPGLTAQRVVLLLHAARSVRQYGDDITTAWSDATAAERADVLALASALQAEVALSVATGQLEEYRDRPEYALWRLYADGATTTTGFRRMAAEIKAAPAGSRLARVRVIGYVLAALVGMPQRLANGMGRKATPREVASGYLTFLRRGGDVLKRPRRS